MLRRDSGYTIVETMFFLVITTAMFVMLAITMGGRQATTQFVQSVNDTQLSIQGIFDDVRNGTFEHTPGYGCVGGPTGPTITAGTKSLGEDDQCVFLGKLMSFEKKAGNSGLRAFTVLSNRTADNTNPFDAVRNITAAIPRALLSDASKLDADTKYYPIFWGSDVDKVYIPSSNDDLTVSKYVKAFGIFNSLSGLGRFTESSYNNSDFIIFTSDDNINSYNYDEIVQSIDQMSQTPASYVVNDQRGIVVCISADSRKAYLRIGANGDTELVTLNLEKEAIGCK
jgi:hypothetical protein